MRILASGVLLTILTVGAAMAQTPSAQVPGISPATNSPEAIKAATDRGIPVLRPPSGRSRIDMAMRWKAEHLNDCSSTLLSGPGRFRN